ncbi:Rhodanese-like domain-containing protein [Powellomyces hirtus]|nr:Rhodanese-like domain-containing protein [Powellomyces hirtus]
MLARRMPAVLSSAHKRAYGTIAYPEVKALVSSKSSPYTLIDVRNPSETSLGKIPTAHSVPLDQVSSAFALSDADFAATYKFEKPKATDRVVVYCRSGRRSAAAADILEGLGYTSMENYEGSWLDWEAQTQQK